MSILDFVKKGFTIAKDSTTLVLVLFSFSFLWNVMSIPLQIDPANAQISFSLIGLGVVFALVSFYIQAGSLGYVQQVVKTGNASLSDFKASGASNYLRILGIGALIAIFVFILLLLITLVFLVGGGEEPNPIAAIFAVLIAIAGGIGVFLFFLAPYVAVADQTKSFAAIQKSIQVVKANLVTTLGIGAILILIGLGVGFLVGLVLGLLSGILTGTPGQLVNGFVGSVVNAYLGVATTGAYMAFYLSLANAPETPAAEATTT